MMGAGLFLLIACWVKRLPISHAGPGNLLHEARTVSNALMMCWTSSLLMTSDGMSLMMSMLWPAVCASM